jgi:hypothetical protein
MQNGLEKGAHSGAERSGKVPILVPYSSLRSVTDGITSHQNSEFGVGATPDGAKENPPEGGFSAERSGFEPEKQLSPLTGLARHHANRPTPNTTKWLRRTMNAMVPTVVPSSFQAERLFNFRLGNAIIDPGDEIGRVDVTRNRSVFVG